MRNLESRESRQSESSSFIRTIGRHKEFLINGGSIALIGALIWMTVSNIMDGSLQNAVESVADTAGDLRRRADQRTIHVDMDKEILRGEKQPSQQPPQMPDSLTLYFEGLAARPKDALSEKEARCLGVWREYRAIENLDKGLLDKLLVERAKLALKIARCARD